MSDVKWIKIVTDIFDDEKMLLIESLPSADSIIVIWFKLLCLAGKNNNNGVFMMNDRIAYTDEMLATIFRRDVNTVRLALKTFESYGMIELIDGVVTIPNWGKHQTLDRIEQKSEYMKNYMREYRQKQKKKIECKSTCKTNSKANVSEAEVDKDKEDIEVDKELEEEREKDTVLSVSKDTDCRTEARQVIAEWNTLTEFGISGV
ncbi:MAG: phage replisome organizer N-terminal domain-containing protein, partial [Ruminococcus flavefaciens]|nr:phage replisome organizer N-terminal domain-containing protein [Ruminococcus flavefaciens]